MSNLSVKFIRDMAELTIRDARYEDAEFVGWTMLTALGIPPESEFNKIDVWRQEDILYSWTRARIAMVDGEPAGCLISYPGEEYARLRIRTWELIFGSTEDDAEKYDSETFPGEYYLDSLAVRPEYRGHGVGSALLLDGVEKGHTKNYDRITLIVDIEKPENIALYERLGFRKESQMTFFGHEYYRMAFQ